jgi:hypothetical protein
LPEPAEGERSVACGFCGLVTEWPDRPPPVVVRWDLEATTRQLGRKARLALRLGILVAAGVVAFSILRAVRPITEALDSINEQAAQFQERERPVKPEALATLRPNERRRLEIAPPDGGFERFDPVARLDWVRTIARAWVVDAALDRIEAGPIAPGGTVDLSGGTEASVEYRFLSPSRIATWQKEADLEPNAEADYALSLDLIAGTVLAIVQRGRPLYEQVPPSEDLMPLRDLLARARSRAEFPDRPFYAGHVTYVVPEGWLWSFQTLSGRDRVPMVRGRTGALYP